jgi:hypothetical protein
MSERKREREIEYEMGMMKRQMQTLEDELHWIRANKNCLSSVKSKEEALRLLDIYNLNDLKMTPKMETSLLDTIFDEIRENMNMKSYRCIVYYKIGSNWELQVIARDKEGEWKNRCKNIDADDTWVKIYDME